MHDTAQDAPLFGRGERPSVALRQLLRVVEAEWPEMGAPSVQDTGDTTLHVFSARAGVEVLLGAWPDGMLQAGLRIAPDGPYASTDVWAGLMASLGERWRWSAEEEGDSYRFCVGTRFASAGLGVVEEARFREDLLALKRWCDAVSPLHSDGPDEAAVRKAYKPFTGVLTPLLPWSKNHAAKIPELVAWAAAGHDLLRSGLPVGVVGESRVERRLALASLGEACLGNGSSLGWLALPGVNPQKLVQVVEKAPGFVALPARALEMASNPYELGKAVANLMSTLQEMARPCVFEGRYTELQAVFNGGQGAENDPLCPVVCRVPKLPLDLLAGYALHRGLEKRGLPTPRDPDALVADALDALRDHAPEAAKRLLPHVIGNLLSAGASSAGSRSFVARLETHVETFGPLSVGERRRRRPEVQDSLMDRLLDPAFPDFLASHLVGQEAALADYTQRLERELLTRPLHQPLVMALQGTPGTGKSESLDLTARWLGVPHTVIDATNMTDPHTAAAQLLGSGRGIVDSHRPGRLEEVSRLHTGAVVEIADIDHATPAVRSALGDLFLQILQNGEGQSAMGTTFSCANLIFVFTLNLPGGNDEKAYQRTGFGPAPSPDEVRKDVRRALKSMISGAFLSRVGEPILFAPLTREARLTILHRALVGALETGLARLGKGSVTARVSALLAEELMPGHEAGAITFGARGLTGLAGDEVTRALTAWRAAGFPDADRVLELTRDTHGRSHLLPVPGTNIDTPPSGGKGDRA